MTKFTDINELADFIEDRLGSRVRLLGVSPSTRRIDFILYDSFVFSAGIAENTLTFGMALQLPGGFSTSRLLGQKVSINNDPESIARNLELADGYCRLRLPDKFLEAYDKLETGPGSAEQ